MSETVTETAPNPTDASTSTEAAAATLLSSVEAPATTTQQGDTSQAAKPAEGEKPAAETKPATESKPEGAPEKYDFKAPEGTSYDPAVLDTFSAAAKDANLTQDAAQKLLQTMGPALAVRQAEQVKAIQDGWAESSRTDKEFGGEKLQENLALAKKALDQFAPKGSDGSAAEFRTLLETTGLGNNPEVIRFLVRVGKGISEDGFVSGRNGTPPPTDRASILYDKTPQ